MNRLEQNMGLTIGEHSSQTNGASPTAINDSADTKTSDMIPNKKEQQTSYLKQMVHDDTGI